MSISTATLATLRYGYGFRPGETPPSGAADLLAQLDAPDPMIARDLPAIADFYEKLKTRQRAVKANVKDGDGAVSDDLKAANEALRTLRDPLQARRILSPALSPQGFRERLVAFWADHFTVISQGLTLSTLGPLMVETSIRPHVAGKFDEMLIACTLDPAMLIYLDQNVSFGPGSPAGERNKRGLNENLAREVLELHTLGVGGSYTQADVIQFAELLTGYTVMPMEGMVFAANRAEPGAETVLGASYGGKKPNPDDAKNFLRDLARKPDTARHIARKLVVHFVSDTPRDDHVAQVAEAWGDGGDLKAVYAALLDHEAAWAPQLVKARQPLDYSVACLRAFDAVSFEKRRPKLAQQTKRFLRLMGQPLMEPGGPNGWPEEVDAWLTPQGLAGRIRYAKFLSQHYGRKTDPRTFLQDTLQDAADDKLTFAVSAAEQKWEGISLTLLSPVFNRR
ncbi:DUF1800 domain-containing protein [Paroceanicella profunda]|uniref:DUF1800 domain-containing protein n=1 Tax=Paroceanicella profunda TaxID=2579971 RepID=A0A5B8FZ74_9RHOB|nr:DUF1800 domain-containing protein [Paroceanicella profunda]QDL92019.1 DUF1800 domain-containing protein [Paroceanicella profunda]